VGARFSDGIVDEELCFSDGITWDVFSPAGDMDMDISETRPIAGDASDLWGDTVDDALRLAAVVEITFPEGMLLVVLDF